MNKQKGGLTVGDLQDLKDRFMAEAQREAVGGVIGGGYQIVDRIMTEFVDWVMKDADPGAWEADSDGWLKWKGGECPVAKGTLVDVKYRNGMEGTGIPALEREPKYPGFMTAEEWQISDEYLCAGDIVAWRLHDPKRNENG